MTKYRAVFYSLLFTLSLLLSSALAHAEDTGATYELKLANLSSLSFDQALRSLSNAEVSPRVINEPLAMDHSSVFGLETPKSHLPVLFSILTYEPHQSLASFGSPKVLIRSLSPVKMTFLFTFNFGEV